MDTVTDLSTWVDHHGMTHKAPSPRLDKLCFQVTLHARVRAFVFIRDGFRCRICGVEGADPPEEYDGRYTLHVPGRICLELDHVLSQRNGGTHHPSNLQTLCNSCNARKSALVDSVYRRVAGA